MAAMKLRILKWGNSAAIRLPDALLEQIGGAIGDRIEIDLSRLQIIKPKYKLADLMKECDSRVAQPQDITQWETMPPAGNEL